MEYNASEHGEWATHFVTAIQDNDEAHLDHNEGLRISGARRCGLKVGDALAIMGSVWVKRPDSPRVAIERDRVNEIRRLRGAA